MYHHAECYCTAGCAGSLLVTAVANLSYKLRAADEQEWISSFYKNFGKGGRLCLSHIQRVFSWTLLGFGSIGASTWGLEGSPGPGAAFSCTVRRKNLLWLCSESCSNPVARAGAGTHSPRMTEIEGTKILAPWVWLWLDTIWCNWASLLTKKNLLSRSAFPCEQLHFRCISIFLTRKYFLEKFLTVLLLGQELVPSFSQPSVIIFVSIG